MAREEQGPGVAGRQAGRGRRQAIATWLTSLTLSLAAAYFAASLPADVFEGVATPTSTPEATATRAAPPDSSAEALALAAPADGIPASPADEAPADTAAPNGALQVAVAGESEFRIQAVAQENEVDPAGLRERPSLAARGGRRAPEPAQEPTAQPTPERRKQPITYRVVEGDTTAALAERFGISQQTIVKANNLSDAEQLAAGQELVILPISGVLHVVQEGDTLLGLAERYGVIPEEIAAVNSLAEPYLLLPGQELLIPEVPASAMAAEAVPTPGAKVQKPTTYTVAPSDTLSSVAARFGIGVETLRWANPGLGNADLLAVGQQLQVPPVDGVLHATRPGDTVSGVAALYGASAADLVRINGLVEPYTLQVGQVLVVPGGRPLPSPTATPTPGQPSPTPPKPTATTQPTATRVPPTATPVPPTATKVPPTATRVPPTATPARPTATPVPPAAAAAKPEPAAPAPAKPAGGPSRTVEAALQQRGARYAWGGATPQTGFDCSGLVMYALRQAGVAVPRDLWGQLNSGPRVSRDALQPGDVVFFQNTYKPGLSHDGIYIGGGQFVHAASENTGVIVSSLNEGYWSARYVGASRPR